MPTATEPAAPKAAGAAGAAKPKPAPKKPAEGANEKQPAKKPAAAADKKKPAAAADKKPTATADNKKPEAAADNKKPAVDNKKPTTAPSEKKQATEKKQTTDAGADKKKSAVGTVDKKQTTAATDTKAADKKQPTAASGDRRAPKKVEEVADEPAPVPVYVPQLPVALPALNKLEGPSCAKVLENLLDFTPSLGAALAAQRPFKTTQHLVDQLNQTLDGLPLPYIEAFLKRFNELPLIPKSKLTKEHKCCVGLDKLTEEQKAELTPLYSEYRDKFGFPFVVCAREVKAAELAVMLRSHLLNDKDQEMQSGRKEVKKIARMRLLEVVVA